MTLKQTIKQVFFFFALAFSTLIVAEQEDWAEIYKTQMLLVKQGNTKAMFKLAEMYEKGLGTPVDLELAVSYYKAGVDATVSKTRKDAAESNIKIRTINKKQNQQANKNRVAKINTQRPQKNLGRQSTAKQVEQKQSQHKSAAGKRIIDRQNIHKQNIHNRTVVRDTAKSNVSLGIRQGDNEPKANWETIVTEMFLPPIRPTRQQQTKQVKKGYTTVERIQTKPATTRDKAFKTNPCKGAVARFTSTCN